MEAHDHNRLARLAWAVDAESDKRHDDIVALLENILEAVDVRPCDGCSVPKNIHHRGSCPTPVRLLWPNDGPEQPHCCGTWRGENY